MPEGPEAYFIVNSIISDYVDKKLIDIDFVSGRYIKHGPPPNYDDFKKSLPLKLKEVKKKALTVSLNIIQYYSILFIFYF